MQAEVRSSFPMILRIPSWWFFFSLSPSLSFLFQIGSRICSHKCGNNWSFYGWPRCQSIAYTEELQARSDQPSGHPGHSSRGPRDALRPLHHGWVRAPSHSAPPARVKLVPESSLPVRGCPVTHQHFRSPCRSLSQSRLVIEDGADFSFQPVGVCLLSPRFQNSSFVLLGNGSAFLRVPCLKLAVSGSHSSKIKRFVIKVVQLFCAASTNVDWVSF